jgi:hypothetical protein
MCNRHAQIYIDWYCCSSRARHAVCAGIRRACMVERVGCSVHKDKALPA